MNKVKKDIEEGLIPFWFGASYGTAFSLAVDLEPKLVEIVKKYGMWLNLDASFYGAGWICTRHRPTDPTLLEAVDSYQAAREFDTFYTRWTRLDVTKR